MGDAHDDTLEPHTLFVLQRGGTISVPVDTLLTTPLAPDGTIEVETADITLTLRPDPEAS